MAFDPITLAMAKPKVIDLDSYGINIANVVMSGGGKLEIENTEEMWETINAKRNVVMTCALGDEKFTLYPGMVGEKYGLAGVVSMQLVATMGDVMITANIVLVSGVGHAGNAGYTYTGTTGLCVTVNQTALS